MVRPGYELWPSRLLRLWPRLPFLDFNQGPKPPVERGDAATVEKHLAAIEDADDRALYRLLTKRLLRIAKAKHSERDFAAIEELVSQDV